MSTKPKNTQAASAPTVVVKKLHKSFGEQEVLRDINFTVEPGEIFVIMGASGSGKSVLLRHIAGLETANSGSVQVGPHHSDQSKYLDKVNLALVFQSGALLNSLSVFDNLALYPREHQLYSEKEIGKRVHDTLAMLSLEEAAQKTPAELSGGMRKRVAIARALVIQPELLLYDEPTSELDPIMAATISEIIGTLKKQFAVTSIVVSHDRDLALSIADRVALMIKGELRYIDTPANITQIDDPAVKEFFNPIIDTENPRVCALKK